MMLCNFNVPYQEVIFDRLHSSLKRFQKVLAFFLTNLFLQLKSIMIRCSFNIL